MNPQFINIYDITEETYLNWATHPIGEVAKRNARGMRILFIVETVVAVALAVYGFFTTNPLFLIVGGIAITYFIICACIPSIPALISTSPTIWST